MTKAPALDRRKEVKVQEWPGEKEALGVVYSDGSRIDGAAAGATTAEAKYLGRYATVMDAEMLGIALTKPRDTEFHGDARQSRGNRQSYAAIYGAS